MAPASRWIAQDAAGLALAGLAKLPMEFPGRQCSTSRMGQETCATCGQGKSGHSAKVCNEYIAKRQREERMRAEGEQRDQRLVTGAARAASRKTAFMIFGGVAIGVIALVALVISATSNAKEADPSGTPGSTASAAAPRPGIVIRPRHPSP